VDESWNTSLLTGDQCAVCENPLGDASQEFEQDGELLRICGPCATQRRTTQLTDSGAVSVVAEAEARSRTVKELLSCRADEQNQLEEISQFIENLARAVTHWQNSAGELELRSRTLEAEVRRLRERLQRAEELLSAGPRLEAPVPTAESTGIQPKQETPPLAGEPERLKAPLPEHDLPKPHFPEPAPAVDVAARTFGVEELHLAQRFFNESPFTEKTRSVRRSLGRPMVNLTPVAGQGPQILLTVGWEIVWYQFLISLDEIADPAERITLFAEGMELEELNPTFTKSNANLDDEGRIDASELEFSLLADRSGIIDDLSPEQVVLEDATEEIWDRHTAPEFRWDD
jgi:hypothetical protein